MPQSPSLPATKTRKKKKEKKTEKKKKKKEKNKKKSATKAKSSAGAFEFTLPRPADLLVAKLWPIPFWACRKLVTSDCFLLPAAGGTQRFASFCRSVKTAAALMPHLDGRFACVPPPPPPARGADAKPCVHPSPWTKGPCIGSANRRFAAASFHFFQLKIARFSYRPNGLGCVAPT